MYHQLLAETVGIHIPTCFCHCQGPTEACTSWPSSAISGHTLLTSFSCQDYIILKSLDGASVLVECAIHLSSPESSVQKKIQDSSNYWQNMLNFYHQSSLGSASAGSVLTVTPSEHGLDSMSLHWWALVLNFVVK